MNENTKRLVKSLNAQRIALINNLNEFRHNEQNRKFLEPSYFSLTVNKYKKKIKELDELIYNGKNIKDFGKCACIDTVSDPLLPLFHLQPQVTKPEYGREPSLHSMVERYYKPHFPKDYKKRVDVYFTNLLKEFNKND